MTSRSPAPASLRAARATLAALLFAAPAAAAELVDGIAAQVGSEVVLVSEVDSMIRPIEARARAQGATDADIESIRAQALDELIERHAIAQAAKRAELDASDAEIDDAIASIAEENGISVEQVKKNVAQGGLSWDAYRAKIRSEIVHAKMLNGMVRSKVRVSDEEVRRLYDEKYAKMAGGDEVHLRHIVVTFGKEQKRTEAEACGQVKDALAKIRSGTPFEEIAGRISEANPERGGDAGWVPVKAMPGWMVDATRDLEPGQLGDVVRMPFGCNLFQVVERRTVEKKPYDQVKEQLRAMIVEERSQGEYRKFMEKLRAQTYIEKRGNLATARVAPSPPPVGASSEVGIPSDGSGRDSFDE